MHVVDHVGKEGPVADVDNDIDDGVAGGVEEWKLLGETATVTGKAAGKARVDEGVEEAAVVDVATREGVAAWTAVPGEEAVAAPELGQSTEDGLTDGEGVIRKGGSQPSGWEDVGGEECCGAGDEGGEAVVEEPGVKLQRWSIAERGEETADDGRLLDRIAEARAEVGVLEGVVGVHAHEVMVETGDELVEAARHGAETGEVVADSVSDEDGEGVSIGH